MRRSPGNSVTEFEELRHLLLSRERRELRELREQLTDKERRSRDVAAILPAAVKLSRERGDELTRALRPAVEASVKDSIEQRPQIFVEALHPIIGPIVRRSIAESLRRLLQSLNQTLEHTFSWRGLKWRFEAMRTGRSFAEVVMLRSLLYRVEQLFLIHRGTSLTLLHLTADSAISRDADMVGGMLSAIQDFARDSFATGDDSALEEFRVGELQVWIAPGPHAYLAAVIRGNPPRELRTTMEETIENVHILKGDQLATFDGDAAVFESLRPDLESCLQSQYSAERSGKRPMRAGLLLVALAAAVLTLVVLAARSEAKWQNFLSDLRDQPGIVVTSASKGWISPSVVRGLRDASAIDPVTVALGVGLDPTRILFDWKSYLGLEPSSVQRRFEQRFPLPRGVQVFLNDSTLEVAGSVPYEWLDRVYRDATLIPGITAISSKNAQIIYDHNLARERFETRFGLPDGAFVDLTNGVLTLSGEASHRWLARVRAEATKVPGITSINDHAIVDLDERTFTQSKSIIEHAFVYFLFNKDNIATEGFTALSRLPEEIRRCDAAARRIGLEISLEINGYADAVGDETKNIDLSQRRAQKVSDFLVSCGFDAAMLHPAAVGRPNPAPDQVATPEEADRRVEFKVVSHPVTTAP